MFAAAFHRDFASPRHHGKLAAFLAVSFLLSFVFPAAAWIVALIAPALACMTASRDRAAGTDDQLRVAGVGAVEAAASAMVAQMAWVVAILIASVPALAMFANIADLAAVPRQLAIAFAVGCVGTGAGLAVGRRLPGIIGMLGSYVALAVLVYAPGTPLGLANLFETGAGWQSILLAIDIGLIVAIAGFARRSSHVRETRRKSAPVDRSAVSWAEIRRWRSPAAATAIVGSVAIAELIGRYLGDNQLPHATIFATLLAPVILATLAGASSIASERERGTLALLRLAVNDGEIVRGKVAGFLRGTWMLLLVPAATALATGEGILVARFVAIVTLGLVTSALAIGVLSSRAFRSATVATLFAFAVSAASSAILTAIAIFGLGEVDRAFEDTQLILAAWAATAVITLFLATRDDAFALVDQDLDREIPTMRAPDGKHARKRATPDVARDVRRLHERIDDAPAGRLTVAEVGAAGAVSVADDPRGRLSAARKTTK